MRFVIIPSPILTIRFALIHLKIQLYVHLNTSELSRKLNRFKLCQSYSKFNKGNNLPFEVTYQLFSLLVSQASTVKQNLPFLKFAELLKIERDV